MVKLPMNMIIAGPEDEHRKHELDAGYMQHDIAVDMVVVYIAKKN